MTTDTRPPHRRGVGRPRQRRSRDTVRAPWWVHALALLVVIVALTPVLWLVIASVTPSPDLLTRPLRWVPHRLDLSRYADVLAGSAQSPAGAFRQAMVNSLVVAAGTVALSISVGTLGAYAFARLEFPGRRAVLLAFLGTYMLPPIALLIPLYLILARAHLLDSRIGLILVYSSFSTPFVLWTLSGYFAGLPRDIEDAARIDGCSRLGALWHVILPISRPGLFSAVLFATLLCWDEFIYALNFTSTSAAKTIPVAIADFSAKYSTDFGLVSVGGILAALPPVLVALALQRFLVAGLTSGGVKG